MSLMDDLTDRWEEMWARGIDLSPEELCDDPLLLDELRRQIHILRSFQMRFGCDDVVRPQPATSSLPEYCPPADLTTSTRLRIESCYATGGLGQVFVAIDDRLGRRVAVKFPKRQQMTAQQIERFELEARITGQLEHPGIVPVHALDATAAGEPCYVMRLVEGDTLSETVSQQLANYQKPDQEYWDSDSFRKLLQALIQVANTVAYAHTKGYVHRDIKPQNILLGPFGETLLLDWGIAKRFSINDEYVNADSKLNQAHGLDTDEPGRLTEPGRVVGTPAYASPEQLLETNGILSPAADVYSLGITLFYMISGQTPLDAWGWTGYWNRIRDATMDMASLLPENLPQGLRAIVNKATRLAPTERYQDPLIFAADLDHYLAGEQISVLADSLWTRWGRWFRKHPGYAGGTMAGTAVFLGATLLVTFVVSLKNQQLTQSSSRLTTALASVQSANSVAMRALRSMVNESVSRRMAQHDELSLEDRAYIDGILKQYAAIAAIKQNLAETKALRAEALGQVGSLYYHLNQNSEAEENLQQSLQLYQELLVVSPDLALRDQYVGLAEVQVALLTESGKFQAVEDLATHAIDRMVIQLPGETTATSVPPLPVELESTVASLFMMRANARIKLKRLDLGIQDFKQSVAILEESLAARPEDVSLKYQTGSHLRTFGSLLNDNADAASQRDQAMQMANRAVELLEVAVSKRPEARNYVSSLAWAYYDRSYIHEAQNNVRQALADMDTAYKWTKQIADKYPVIGDYRKRLVPMLRRQAILRTTSGDYQNAFRDAQAMTQLELTPLQLDQCIELLREIETHWNPSFDQSQTPQELLRQLQDRR